jgi:hypothetical protein
MAVRIQFRRDTAANWTSRNPILADGEMGIEKVTKLFKLGDGVTAWNDLEYGGVQGPAGDDGAPGADGADGADGIGANFNIEKCVILSADVPIAQDSFVSTFISDLAVPLSTANQLYRADFLLASQGSGAARPQWRAFFNYPQSSGWKFISGVAVFNSGSTQSTLQPADDTDMNAQLDPQLQANNNVMMQYSVWIKTGSSPGTLAIGLRSVNSGGATLLGDLSYAQSRKITAI